MFDVLNTQHIPDEPQSSSQDPDLPAVHLLLPWQAQTLNDDVTTLAYSWLLTSPQDDQLESTAHNACMLADTASGSMNDSHAGRHQLCLCPASEQVAGDGCCEHSMSEQQLGQCATPDRLLLQHQQLVDSQESALEHTQVDALTDMDFQGSHGRFGRVAPWNNARSRIVKRKTARARTTKKALMNLLQAALDKVAHGRSPDQDNADLKKVNSESAFFLGPCIAGQRESPPITHNSVVLSFCSCLTRALDGVTYPVLHHGATRIAFYAASKTITCRPHMDWLGTML